LPRQNSLEERQLIQLLEQIPLSEEVKNAWIEAIRSNGLTGELAEEMRQKISTDESLANRTGYTMKLVGIVRRWRLSQQTQGAKRHNR